MRLNLLGVGMKYIFLINFLILLFMLGFVVVSFSGRTQQANYVPGEILVKLNPGTSDEKRDAIFSTIGTAKALHVPNLFLVKLKKRNFC